MPSVEETSKKICVALDALPKKKALDLAKTLSGKVWGFKVNDLLTREGISIVEELKPHGKVFADPKLHDIPNTVANCVKALEHADLITVHCSGGLDMLLAAREAASADTGLLGITLLTSLDKKAVESVYEEDIEVLIMRFGRLAIAAGLDGIVASPQEAASIRKFTTFNNLMIVTPGIRATSSSGDDQQRTGTAQTTLASGADLLVVGRPIVQHEDPVQGLFDIASL